jgi:hypothetical protein
MSQLGIGTQCLEASENFGDAVKKEFPARGCNGDQNRKKMESRFQGGAGCVVGFVPGLFPLHFTPWLISRIEAPLMLASGDLPTVSEPYPTQPNIQVAQTQK